MSHEDDIGHILLMQHLYRNVIPPATRHPQPLLFSLFICLLFL